MTETPDHSPPPGTPRGVDVQALFRTLWAERVPVLLTVLLTMGVVYGASFALPKWYKADAVILPPEEADLLKNMAMAQRALTKFPTFGILSEYFTPADVYKAILGSRTVQEEVAKRFDLQTVYKKKSMEKTVKELRQHYKVKLNGDGTIQVTVEDRDRNRAAYMANAFLQLLDQFNVENRTYQAKRTRQFLERRVRETDSLLRVSEELLKVYQEKHHTVVPPVSASSGDLQSAADLMARKITLEVRLGVLRGYMREDNDQVIQLQSELDQLKRRIAQLPAMQTDLERLVRDNKVQEQLFLLLTAELEQARIREAMDTPTVQILDKAIAPERHAWPRRSLLALGAGMLAFAAVVVRTALGRRIAWPAAS